MLTKFFSTRCPQALSLVWRSKYSPAIFPVTGGEGGRDPQQGPAVPGGTAVLFELTHEGLRTSPCAPDLGTPDDAPRLLLGPE